jgi:hypothetical protein
MITVGTFRIGRETRRYAVEEIFNKLNQHICTIRLMTLYGSEEELDDGRFEHFSHARQEYVVKILAPPTGEAMTYHTAKMVEWIAEQTDDPWSMILDYHHLGNIDIDFSFADHAVATLFKLVWYRTKW